MLCQAARGSREGAAWIGAGIGGWGGEEPQNNRTASCGPKGSHSPFFCALRASVLPCLLPSTLGSMMGSSLSLCRPSPGEPVCGASAGAGGQHRQVPLLRQGQPRCHTVQVRQPSSSPSPRPGRQNKVKFMGGDKGSSIGQDRDKRNK